KAPIPRTTTAAPAPASPGPSSPRRVRRLPLRRRQPRRQARPRHRRPRLARARRASSRRTSTGDAAGRQPLPHLRRLRHFRLAFVLSSPSVHGWQGAGTISDDTLANGTTILSQVKAIQAAGGDVTISFGGAAGQEAALTAMTAANLQAGYQSVIDRY